MNAPPVSQVNTPTQPPRFDRKFIEDHQLVERYLQNQLPVKGALELEHWCRAHPEYLHSLHLSERAQASLKLLEASGQPQDLREPKPAWWKSIYVPIALGAVSCLSLAAFWVLFGKYELLRSELVDARALMSHGSLVQPAIETSVHVTPDHSPGLGQARIVVSRTAPQLMGVHIDLGYTNKFTQFRVVVDKKDQGRALILNNVLKDSNGELRMTLNSTGLSAGIYDIRIDALPFRGSPLEVGWLILEVR